MNLKALEQEKIDKLKSVTMVDVGKELVAEGFTPLPNNSYIFNSELGFTVKVEVLLTGSILSYDYCVDGELLSDSMNYDDEDNLVIVSINKTVEKAVAMVTEFINGNYPDNDYFPNCNLD